MPTTIDPNDCGGQSDPDELWQRVRYTLKDIPRGFFVLRDSPTSYLLAATDRITGIECDRLWKDQTPHYWKFAWEVAQRYSGPNELPQSRIGMAMNARWNHEKKPSRGHDQLHIHVSCIQKGVQTTLDTLDGKGQIATKPEDWGKSVQPIPAGGPNYRLLRQDENVLSEHNLFKFLFEVLKKVWGDETKAAANMPYQTLVVAKRKAGGFYILNSDDRITLTPGTGHGEDLLDKQCS